MEKNEILFWRVYRNVVINKIIYFQLLNTKIEFDYDRYYVGNRRRFGDIHSFKWMVENNQFDLLKYKLKRNEYVEEFCLQYLLKSISNPVTYSKSIEIFEIIINKSEYRELIPYGNFLKQILIYNNNEILKIILNNYFYNYKQINWITIEHLKYSISNCSQPTINNLLKFINKNIIDDNFKNKSIEWSLNNKYDFDGSITSIILNDNGLFNLVKLELKIPFKLTSGKIDVLIKLIELDFFNNTSDIENFYSLIFIPCKSKQLLNIETIIFFFKFYYKCTTTTTKIPNEIKKEIDGFIMDYSDVNKIEKEKQLLKLLIKTTNSKLIYSLYYFNYYELIDGRNNNCFKLLKTNGIFEKLNKLVDKYEAIEFLTLFLNEITWRNWMKNIKLAEKISDVVFSKFDCFKEVLNNVGKQKLKFIINHFSKTPITIKKVDSILLQFVKSIIEYDLNKSDSLIDLINKEKFINHWNKTIKLKESIIFKEKKIIFIPNCMVIKIKDNLNYWIEKTKIESMLPVCNVIINYLYKKLLQIKDINYEQIKEIKNLCETSPIKLEHSTFHSFFYLNIKSNKIIKYILSFNRLFSKDKGFCGCRIKIHVLNDKDVVDETIQSDLFTFEYIFEGNNNSFECLFKYFSNIPTQGFFFIKHQLKYLLEIDRLDLFFSILENVALNKTNGGEYLCGMELEFVKQIIRSIDYNQITTSLKRYIELIKIINGRYFLLFQEKMLSVVIKLYRKDLISFIINEYNITYIKNLDLSWYNYPMIEYLYINHPTVHLKILENIIGVRDSHYFIQMLKLAIKHNKISDLDISHVINISKKSNDAILLNILLENGLLKS
ncbi:hypothetical protein ACTA71_011417 [Dictyostelium dimigraforme]